MNPHPQPSMGEWVVIGLCGAVLFAAVIANLIAALRGITVRQSATRSSILFGHSTDACKAATSLFSCQKFLTNYGSNISLRNVNTA
jgi:hypothetical protein